MRSAWDQGISCPVLREISIDVATKLCRIVVHTCTCTFILKKVWASVETKKWAYLVRFITLCNGRSMYQYKVHAKQRLVIVESRKFL